MPMITQDDLQVHLHYDPKTGVFTRKLSSTRWKAGDVAGFVNARGYRIIRIGNVGYRASRLAWLYMTGTFPAQQVDHINRNKSDDRFSNLREASVQQNSINRVRRNKSGIPGVHFSEGRWRTSIRVNGRLIFLGYFDNPERAGATYLRAKAKYHGSEFLPQTLRTP